MDIIYFTKVEKDHLAYLVERHKNWLLEQFNNADTDGERETLTVSLKVDQDICDKLWYDKEKQNKLAELKTKLEKVKK